MYSRSSRKSWQQFALLASLFALLTNNFNAFAEGPKPIRHDQARQIKTESPIKHVIVLIGENRTFDPTSTA
jgi:phospholipase C